MAVYKGLVDCYFYINQCFIVMLKVTEITIESHWIDTLRVVRIKAKYDKKYINNTVEWLTLLNPFATANTLLCSWIYQPAKNIPRPGISNKDIFQVCFTWTGNIIWGTYNNIIWRTYNNIIWGTYNITWGGVWRFGICGTARSWRLIKVIH